MITQILIVRLYDGEDTSYEIRDQNGTYLHDNDTIEAATNYALDLAETHDIERIQIQVATESV